MPFRWDLVTPDQLGTLLDGAVPPSLWFLDELVTCTGKVLARSGNGDLYFVGRSLDSMFDLLGGVLAGPVGVQRLHRLPLSFQRPAVRSGSRRWRRRPLTRAEVAQGRRFLDAVGLTPRALARRDRPAVLVDVVHRGGTFTELFTLLRDWMLPAAAVTNVSLDPSVWSHFGDHQVKLTRSLYPDRWLAEDTGPGRGERTRQALAEAAALVAYGRSWAGRHAVARAIGRDHALAQPWLRTLVTNLTNS
ncbi:hypothetical protein O7632_15140 [Solwaraspora sp. WMMD406]|uniref:hypothetical protein n=1 Tax=Solwaraspora sp. WMMD406 TaxID=3016095 RepID=UPI0024170EF9|nr:hypothetical protein [Solwaraspora sp. WMMD406]MDG4765420.1 hypothetical protein [Solwaraspora sp. WMMD406]